MGVEYDLVSDSAREGYELGKGPWGDGDGFAEALRTASVEVVTKFIVEEGPDWSPDYAAEIARAVIVFAAAHPDWRVIGDGSSDIQVMDDERIAEDRAEYVADGKDPDVDEDWAPRYRKVGSRYRR